MTTLDEPFLTALGDRRLMIQYCRACAWANLPPRMRCPQCGGTVFAWREASGRGRLRSFAVQHRAPPEHADRLPYVYALVRLEEGPTIISNVAADVPGLDVGLELEIAFADAGGDELAWPAFVPAHQADE